MMNIKAKIHSEAEKIFPELVELRREIHKHPELAYEEYRTSRLISEYLKALGLDVQEGVAKTGVVAHLKGERKSERSKVVALRADIDALPMHREAFEAADLPTDSAPILMPCPCPKKPRITFAQRLKAKCTHADTTHTQPSCLALPKFYPT
jgi:hypothetical protein